MKFGFSTLQRWYYAARKAADPVGMLRRRRRNDAGQTRRLCLALRERVRAQYREHPGWSVQLHYDNLAAAAAEDPSLGAMPSYATLRRYFKAQGLHRRRTPKRDTPGALAADGSSKRPCDGSLLESASCDKNRRWLTAYIVSH